MKNEAQKINYDIYLRKSSEAEDKQIQSIDDQRRELKEFAVRNGLNIIGEFEESQSAHHPGRPIFNNVMKRIEKGISNGLLVWHANRTSRNPVDSGTLINLIDEGKLIHVRTPSHIYGNTSTEKMMLALECMMAKKDSDDKSEAVKRGLRGRYIKGLPNGVAPIGFLNDKSGEKGNRKWLVDKDRFESVRRLLEEFLTGRYSIRKLMNFANDKLGLRTTLHSKQGGKKLGISYICDTILKNPVFAGFFFAKDGVRHELSKDVPRIITEDQYWQIQKIIGNRGRSRPSKNIHLFAYVGPTQCGTCGGSVTAEHKHQLICSECKNKFSFSHKTHCPKCKIAIEKMKDPLYLHYVYYHCTKNKDRNCPEGSVSELYIDGYLSLYYKQNLQISKSLSEWCIDNLEQLGSSDHKDKLEIKISLEKTLTKKENELKELALMKTRGLLEDDEFLSLKAILGAEIRGLRKEIQDLNHIDPQRLERAQRAFNLAVGVAKIFEMGTTKEKKEALSEIGSNLTIKEKKLNVSNTNLYSVIINGLLLAKTKNPQFEPENIVDTSGRNKVFADVCPALLRG